MRRLILYTGALLLLAAWTQPNPPPVVAAKVPTHPVNLSPWLLAAPRNPTINSGATGKLGYHIIRTSQYCPGLPANQTCTWFAPQAVYAHLNIDNLGGSGRVGRPANISLECDHFRTVNGVTTVQSGVAAYFQPPTTRVTITPGSLAGILSADTPDNWFADRHSLAFGSIQGAYLTTNVKTAYRIFGVEVRDNVMQSAVAGGLTADVRGTLLNYRYNGSGFDLTGYSQGHVSCFTGGTAPAGPGRFSRGYNQVFSNT
jgi:hypothetical protein